MSFHCCTKNLQLINGCDPSASTGITPKGYHLLKYLLSTNVNILNPSNAELNPICQLLALLGAHPILHVSRIKVNEIN
jgi:hypothetical protein